MRGGGKHSLVTLPAGCDLQPLGLDAGQITGTTLISQKDGHAVYRLTCGRQSYVLKWFEGPAPPVEVAGYALLEQLGVPTLPVHGRAANALLLPDLEASAEWRPATEADVERAETGAAVAEWYRNLHAAGRTVLADPQTAPGFLKREADALDAATILKTGEALGLAAYPVWRLAAEHIEALKHAMRSLPETLTYNDFHWTNLALSRTQKPARRAIVYDYHLLGIGLRYSDCRNVVGSLRGPARRAFWEVYGDPDEREVALDGPVSVVYTLSLAVRLPRLPAWALACRHEVMSGALKLDLERALDILPLYGRATLSAPDRDTCVGTGWTRAVTLR